MAGVDALVDADVDGDALGVDDLGQEVDLPLAVGRVQVLVIGAPLPDRGEMAPQFLLDVSLHGPLRARPQPANARAAVQFRPQAAGSERAQRKPTWEVVVSTGCA